MFSARHAPRFHDHQCDLGTCAASLLLPSLLLLNSSIEDRPGEDLIVRGMLLSVP